MTSDIQTQKGRYSPHYEVHYKSNRGYYMAAWRYEISLLVLKKYFTSDILG